MNQATCDQRVDNRLRFFCEIGVDNVEPRQGVVAGAWAAQEILAPQTALQIALMSY